MVTISFPGLGIEPFTVNPVAFTIPLFGGIEVRWYGLIITMGIILAFTYCAYRAKQEGVDFDNLLDIALFTIPLSVVGARLYYVLTSLDQYDSLWEAIDIRGGGLAIYGAVIAGACTIYGVCRYKKIPPLKMMDAVAPGVMIGQILGRWGNFFNGEAYGSRILGGILYPFRMGLLPNVESRVEMYYFHPTFLYESLWNLVGFILIHFLYKKKKFDGQVVLMYITWYGFGRMFIEGLRVDSLYIFGVFRISQVIGFLCFVIGSILLTFNLMKARRKALTEQDYTPSYPRASRMAASSSEQEAEDPMENVDEDSSDTLE